MRKVIFATVVGVALFFGSGVASAANPYDLVGQNVLGFFAAFFEDHVYPQDSVQYQECAKLANTMLKTSGIEDMGFQEIFVIAANFSGMEVYAGRLLGQALSLDGYQLQEQTSDGVTTDMLLFLNFNSRTMAMVYAFAGPSIMMPSAKNGDVCFTVYGMED